MATVRANLPHEDRTATEPRQGNIHAVVLSKIEPVNKDIKLFKLSIQDREKGVKFLPGQWLDVMIPGLPKAGGFTLTSTPAQASSSSKDPFLELAVQRSENPPAKWLWQNPDKILETPLRVRVGGSFTYPPPDIEEKGIEKMVFVAGGVGINPLISMLSHLASTSALLPKIDFLYSVNGTSFAGDSQGTDAGKILFYERLQEIVSSHSDRMNLELFLTGTRGGAKDSGISTYNEGRITQNHLLKAVNSQDPAVLKKTVCFVCGPPAMTDSIVAFLEKQGARVYCEKWW